MKLRMLVTKKGSTDGIHITTYNQGEEHDLPPDLYHAMVNAGFAEQVGEKEIIPDPGPMKADKKNANPAKRKNKR